MLHQSYCLPVQRFDRTLPGHEHCLDCGTEDVLHRDDVGRRVSGGGGGGRGESDEVSCIIGVRDVQGQKHAGRTVLTKETSGQSVSGRPRHVQHVRLNSVSVCQCTSVLSELRNLHDAKLGYEKHISNRN